MKEWTEADFARAARLYIPIKKDIHIRLDADIVEWLKQNGKGYQTRANEINRQAMLADVT
ncbi:MAG: BrnA antitoxin family protein [Spirochaetota bacterium]